MTLASYPTSSSLVPTTSGSESVDVRSWDLDVILRNVCELYKLVSENERTVEYVGEN